VATELMGISVRRLSSFIWALTGLLAGIAGILTAPVAGSFAPGFLTTTALIPGFTGAVLGGMKSLPGAFVGGVVVGVAQSLAVSSPAFHSIPGAGSVMIFALLLVVLTVRPQGLLGKA
jgi:branched-chain amino acid transport system permease protein